MEPLLRNRRVTVLAHIWWFDTDAVFRNTDNGWWWWCWIWLNFRAYGKGRGREEGSLAKVSSFVTVSQKVHVVLEGFAPPPPSKMCNSSPTPTPMEEKITFCYVWYIFTKHYTCFSLQFMEQTPFQPFTNNCNIKFGSFNCSSDNIPPSAVIGLGWLLVKITGVGRRVIERGGGVVNRPSDPRADLHRCNCGGTWLIQQGLWWGMGQSRESVGKQNPDWDWELGQRSGSSVWMIGPQTTTVLLVSGSER